MNDGAGTICFILKVTSCIANIHSFENRCGYKCITNPDDSYFKCINVHI